MKWDEINRLRQFKSPNKKMYDVGKQSSSSSVELWCVCPPGKTTNPPDIVTCFLSSYYWLLPNRRNVNWNLIWNKAIKTIIIGVQDQNIIHKRKPKILLHLLVLNRASKLCSGSPLKCFTKPAQVLIISQAEIFLLSRWWISSLLILAASMKSFSVSPPVHIRSMVKECKFVNSQTQLSVK